MFELNVTVPGDYIEVVFVPDFLTDFLPVSPRADLRNINS